MAGKVIKTALGWNSQFYFPKKQVGIIIAIKESTLDLKKNFRKKTGSYVSREDSNDFSFLPTSFREDGLTALVYSLLFNFC